MNLFWPFFVKELLEPIRTKRVWLLLGLFVLCGCLGVGVLKLTEWSVTISEEAGVAMDLPPLGARDAYELFLQNLYFIGIISLALILGTTLTREYKHDTLVNLVTKGLPREVVILAKYAGMVAYFEVALLLAFVINRLFLRYYFPTDTYANEWLSFGAVSLYGMLLIALMLMVSAWIRSSYGSFVAVMLFYFSLSLLASFDKLAKYLPLSLTDNASKMLVEPFKISTLYPQLAVTTALIVLFIGSALLLFKRQQL